MFTTRTSPSLRLVIVAMICVSALCDSGWADNPPKAAPPAKRFDDASPLRSEPALQVKLTVKFKHPKAQDIIERLRAETKLDLALADNIDREQPALGGFSGRNVPAWVILEELAKSKIIQGKWERHGNGYLLTSPLPPPAVANADSPAPPGPAKLGLSYLLFALPLVTVFGILFVVRYRRRSQQSVAADEPPTAPKLPSSV